jgi:hypothetical protein
MSLLIDALDNIIPENMQLGENGHYEYKFSETDIQEQILQLYFQLVRTSETCTLKQKFEDILKHIFSLEFNSILQNKKQIVLYMTVILQLVCQTRDIVAGKGEYALAYMLLFGLYNYYPDFALYALEKFVSLEDGKHPYGSWKDMKYIAHYCKSNCDNKTNHEMIKKCIQLINAQLVKDDICENDLDVSLCAKWVPREGSKAHGWFFKLLAKDFFKGHDFMSKTDSSLSLKGYTKADKKCYTKYRQMLAKLNKRIDTVQIKQCGNTWTNIDHNKTTSITLSRNKKAFLNITKAGETRSLSIDRIVCAQNFKKYIESRIRSGKEVKGARVGLNHFTRQALEFINNSASNVLEIDLLNSQWRSNSSQNGSLNKMIAMVDTSGSMYGEPLEVAIALGIRVAEKSLLGKRILTFTSKPTWHNLDKDDDFVSMVRNLKDAVWHGSTNFYAALQLILDTMITNKIPPEDTEGLVLAIFSDMQINEADRSFNASSMNETIHTMYENTGYKCPHILFWNLRSTDGFPSLSSDKGVSMMSGFSPVLLNQFCEKGLDALDQATPWNMMVESLNHERYSCLNEPIVQHYNDLVTV